MTVSTNFDFLLFGKLQSSLNMLFPLFLKTLHDWGCNSMVECLPSKKEDQASNPQHYKQKQKPNKTTQGPEFKTPLPPHKKTPYV
jgi:hypothetical protein